MSDGAGPSALRAWDDCAIRLTLDENTEFASKPKSLVGKRGNGTVCMNCSGILLDESDGLVLTSAFIFAEFLVEGLHSPVLRPNTSIHVLRRRRRDGAAEDWIWEPADVLSALLIRPARKAWKAARGTAGDWTVGWGGGSGGGHGRGESGSDENWNKVILLRIRRQQASSPDCVTSASRGVSVPVHGARVWLRGSPFGVNVPAVFNNWVSTALVSSVIGDERDVALAFVDAHVHPGAEGGPVVDAHGCLVGMVLPPFRTTLESSAHLVPILPANALLQAVREGIARQRGFVRHGGAWDREKAAKTFIADYRAGDLGKYTLDLIEDSGRGVVGPSKASVPSRTPVSDSPRAVP